MECGWDVVAYPSLPGKRTLPLAFFFFLRLRFGSAAAFSSGPACRSTVGPPSGVDLDSGTGWASGTVLASDTGFVSTGCFAADAVVWPADGRRTGAIRTGAAAATAATAAGKADAGAGGIAVVGAMFIDSGFVPSSRVWNWIDYIYT